MADLRPISLCYTSYKIISKLVVNHIKPFLNDYISPCQSSYVPGCSIIDNIILVKEIAHSIAKSRTKTKTMAIKIDLSKAYDSLQWPFIEDTFRFFEFPHKLHNVIMTCVMTNSMQVLWNGQPRPSFQPRRGIKQGDPLSPYIFVLCMERLSLLI